ncbi:MAG: SO_0444 family Cu/Zn efflux transporter [Deltaproteobacteria bacterium]|nr:SO_0444 family Cu/Zn efflux transporter [Deltaproteobacteria bacterium]
MTFIGQILQSSWALFVEAAPYLFVGVLVAGMMYLFLAPETIAKHLHRGRISSVFKAALLGIPLPLCSCGVLPAAASLRKQGANKGATAAFLISTPESGVDSIAITYALLDPLMTLIRPLAAFLTAFAAGIMENLFGWEDKKSGLLSGVDLSCRVDGCCDGRNCPPEEHNKHHTLWQKLWKALNYGFFDLYREISGWIFAGFLVAGVITLWLPQDLASKYLGGGLNTMLFMLAAGIPTYICATASTPVAAALILKGVSPGAALVFLLAGPATNVASLTVLTRVLGKRGVAIYLGSIAVFAVIFGLLTDWLYAFLGISLQTRLASSTSELLPGWLHLALALFLAILMLAFFVRGMVSFLKSKINPTPEHQS